MAKSLTSQRLTFEAGFENGFGRDGRLDMLYGGLTFCGLLWPSFVGNFVGNFVEWLVVAEPHECSHIRQRVERGPDSSTKVSKLQSNPNGIRDVQTATDECCANNKPGYCPWPECSAAVWPHSLHTPLMSRPGE
jgi:hypothetical protein